MQRGFGGGAFEPLIEERRDKEVTLGPTMLAAIGCGLLLLCGMTFVLGYGVGRRSSNEAATAVEKTAPAPEVTRVASLQPKPSAAQNGTQSVTAPVGDVATSSAADAAASDAGSPATVPIQGTDAGVASGRTPAVQAALPAQGVAQSGVRAGGTVSPVLPQTGTIMVQIAAVSHPEDAQVLVGALRKRGYAVTTRRDPIDGMLHVQVGPFNSLVDASAMRTKLLNDGYNAIVQ